jgi:hypothetical protein
MVMEHKGTDVGVGSQGAQVALHNQPRFRREVRDAVTLYLLGQGLNYGSSANLLSHLVDDLRNAAQLSELGFKVSVDAAPGVPLQAAKIELTMEDKVTPALEIARLKIEHQTWMNNALHRMREIAERADGIKARMHQYAKPFDGASSQGEGAPSHSVVYELAKDILQLASGVAVVREDQSIEFVETPKGFDEVNAGFDLRIAQDLCNSLGVPFGYLAPGQPVKVLYPEKKQMPRRYQMLAKGRAILTPADAEHYLADRLRRAPWYEHMPVLDPDTHRAISLVLTDYSKVKADLSAVTFERDVAQGRLTGIAGHLRKLGSFLREGAPFVDKRGDLMREAGKKIAEILGLIVS